MSRDKNVNSKATTAAPGHTPSVDIVELVAGMMNLWGKRREESERRGRNKREGESQLVGGSPRQGCRDLHFRKVSKLLLSQRATALLGQKPNRRQGSAPFCPKFVCLSSPGSRGEVEAEVFSNFCAFFEFLGRKIRCARMVHCFVFGEGWWGGERNFRRYRSVPRR